MIDWNVPSPKACANLASHSMSFSGRNDRLRFVVAGTENVAINVLDERYLTFGSFVCEILELVLYPFPFGRGSDHLITKCFAVNVLEANYGLADTTLISSMRDDLVVRPNNKDIKVAIHKRSGAIIDLGKDLVSA